MSLEKNWWENYHQADFSLLFPSWKFFASPNSTAMASDMYQNSSMQYILHIKLIIHDFLGKHRNAENMSAVIDRIYGHCTPLLHI